MTWVCPYCGKPVGHEPSTPCCGEIGHEEWVDDEDEALYISNVMLGRVITEAPKASAFRPERVRPSQVTRPSGGSRTLGASRFLPTVRAWRSSAPAWVADKRTPANDAPRYAAQPVFRGTAQDGSTR